MNWKWSFVFVCQAGELEIKSMLLAASLQQFLRGDYELVAAIPQPVSQWGQISTSTQALMSTLNIRSVPITNPIDPNYPIGNKIACLGIESSADKIVFLDSDILCLREFSPQNQCELAENFYAPFAAKPADLATFTRDIQLWQQIYDLFDLPLPQWRVIATVSRELMLPYFNAGVIAIANGMDFAQIWQQCCQRIDAQSNITNKRPWLDQIALPITVSKLNLKHHCLDERFNYPAHLKPLPLPLPIWCHYHWPMVIRREPRLNQLVVKLANSYPLLQTLLLSSPSWAQLLKPYTLTKSTRRSFTFPRLPKSKQLTSSPQLIITGIPRSGTSYLCRLLHSLPDCVMINEPIPIFTPLINELWPWSIATFYQELRRDILDGQPVENKIDNGQIIEDTVISDKRTLYQPQVSRADFLLGTKNTLAYLARIPQLKQVLPQVPIVACVRHPLDTIASWKTSFPHLHNAAVTEFPIGHVNDPFLLPWQRQRLAEIAVTTNLAWRRALLWGYLAEVLLTYAQQLFMIRYEDLVTQPIPLVKQLFRQTLQAPALSFSSLTPSTVRYQREVLDDEDRQAIADICNPYAIEWGYSTGCD